MEKVIIWIKIYIIGSLILFIVAGSCAVYLTMSRTENDRMLTQAQAEVYKAQQKEFEARTDNIGKPIIYEQHYFSPQAK